MADRSKPMGSLTRRSLTIAAGNVLNPGSPSDLLRDAESPTGSARSSTKGSKTRTSTKNDGTVTHEKSAHDKVLEWRNDQQRRATVKKQKTEEKALQSLQLENIRASEGGSVHSSEGTTSGPGQGALQYSGPCQKTRMKSLPGSHWTENPMAMEMMQEMSFTYSVPALQPRLTAFHGTRVPVLILFSLLSTEVGRLAVLDTFWKRIVQHPMVWQGIYCRDYGSRRCVWRTLHGRVGSDKCLCHLGNTNPPLFSKFCKQITAIPGRSSDELLENYRSWRKNLALQDEQKRNAGELDDLLTQVAPSEVTLQLGDTTATAEPQQEWSVRAHASYGLGPGHGLRIQYGEQFEDPKAVIEASAWCRERIGGPPKRSLLKPLAVKPKASPRR